MNVLGRTIGGSTAALICVLLAGCFHRQQVPQLAPQAQTPNIYVPPPTDAKLPPMESAPPPNLTDAKPVAAAEAKPKKRVKKQQAPPAPAVAAVPLTPAPAVDPPPVEAAATLGELAPGGNSNPKQQQEVADKIAAVEKRISDLPAATAERQQKQIAKVRLFLKEASDALKGGDVEGAKILATKADLLVDDLQK